MHADSQVSCDQVCSRPCNSCRSIILLESNLGFTQLHDLVQKAEASGTEVSLVLLSGQRDRGAAPSAVCPWLCSLDLTGTV